MIAMGPQEALIVGAIVLLLFAPKRLPELAKGIGKSVQEFRKGSRGEGEEETEEQSDQSKE